MELTDKQERFHPMPGFEGTYEINKEGIVRSLDRVVNWCNGRKRRIKGQILSAHTINTGYKMIHLYRNNKKHYMLLHRALALAFIPNPDNKSCVNHINGVKTDNRINNLEWCTYSENLKHAASHGMLNPHMKGKHGKDCHNSKKVIKRSLDGVFIKVYHSAKDAAIDNGMCHSSVTMACRGVFKTSGGYKWEYKTLNNG